MAASTGTRCGSARAAAPRARPARRAIAGRLGGRGRRHRVRGRPLVGAARPTSAARAIFAAALRVALLKPRGGCRRPLVQGPARPARTRARDRRRAAARRRPRRPLLRARDGAHASTPSRQAPGSAPARRADGRSCAPVAPTSRSSTSAATSTPGCRGSTPTTPSGPWMPLVLAAAGLERLGRLDAVTQHLELALVADHARPEGPRRRDPRGRARARRASSTTRPSHLAADAERGVLARLEAGCSAPIAAHAFLEDGMMFLSGRVYSPDGSAQADRRRTRSTWRTRRIRPATSPPASPTRRSAAGAADLAPAIPREQAEPWVRSSPSSVPRRLRATTGLAPAGRRDARAPRRARSCRSSCARARARPVPISSMPGVVQHSLDSLRNEIARGGRRRHRRRHAVRRALDHATPSGRGRPTPTASSTSRPAIAVAEAGDALVVQTDLCLDEFTDHGHCGVLDSAGPRGQRREASSSYRDDGARAGVGRARTLLGLSGMMDGQVARGARRAGRAGRQDAADPRLRREVRVRVLRAVPRGRASRSLEGDRRTYQLDPAQPPRGRPRGRRWTSRRAPTSSWSSPRWLYLDVLADVARGLHRAGVGVPGVGEYAMVEAAAARLDRPRARDRRSLTGIRRAATRKRSACLRPCFHESRTHCCGLRPPLK